jgi:hypothetical protein
MEIPAYPEFRPLDIGDQARFEDAFRQDPPEISEFTFTNLFSWRRAYDFRVSHIDGLLVLSGGQGPKRGFFRPIGAGDTASAVRRLAAERVPFIRVAGKDRGVVAGASGFSEAEDRDNADYLYSVAELTELKGKRFDGKRNLIKKFKRAYAYEYLALDGKTSAECLDFQDIWCVVKDCSGEKSLSDERDAVREMCHNFTGFGLFGGAIRAEGKLVAVAIGQRLNPSTMVMHVLKALPDMPGLYQTMHNEFLLHEGAGYEYVNMEQDLGIEGLRKAKLSYQPVRLVEKWLFKP